MDEKMNILLVDDQPAKLLMYEAVFSELGENLFKVPRSCTAKFTLSTMSQSQSASWRA
jgi:CheY-like chemotaxis protein